MRLRVVLAAFLALVVIIGVGIYLAVRSLSSGLPIRIPVQQCVTTVGEASAVLDPEQMANAATIAAVGIRRGVPDRAVTVALATALQESKLQNVKGGDRDSIGLFQQRPSQGWGTADQIADPRYAAGRFYGALVKVKGWQQLTVEQAAQAVQKSADGTAYARWVDKAQTLTTALTGDAAGAVGCTITDQPAQRGAAAATALAQGVATDWGDVPKVAVNSVVGIALAVDGTRTGWQYAHWLVAHAADQNVQRVRFADQVWTAKSGSWTKTSIDPTSGTVIAEVYS